MAEQKKREKEIILTTPRGVAKWPNLIKPQREIKTAEGIKPVTPNFSINLVLDPADAATIELVDKLKKAHEDGFSAAKAANPKKKLQIMPIKIDDEQDKEGNLTGKTLIRFKCKAEGVKKDGTPWFFRPGVLDAKGRPVPKDVLIYGGSVVKVAYSIRHTAMPTGAFYTSFNLKGVQILILKSQSDRDAAFYGFQEEEGYEADPVNGSDGEEYAGSALEAGSSAPASGSDF